MLLNLRRLLIKFKVDRTHNVYIVGGAGATKFKGWISTTRNELDLTRQSDFNFLFSSRKIDKLLLEHVIEHLTFEDFVQFMSVVKRHLNPGATIRIAVPDANHPSEYVRQLTGVNGLEEGAADHKYFYSIDDFERIADITGYRLERLEYFDREGFFSQKDYDFKNGYVSRCAKEYKGRFTNSDSEYHKMISSVPKHLQDQFKKYNISYTSLLVDFVSC